MSEKDLDGHTIGFKSLVGSHNYNLNDENSDKDYRVYVMPTIHDLYHRDEYRRQIETVEADYAVNDIRILPSVFNKSNFNVLECLFSSDIEFGENLDEKEITLMNELFYRKNDIAKMNLPYLFWACTGTHLEMKKRVNKLWKEKQVYDGKSTMQALRMLDIIYNFAMTDFEDFGSAIRYNDEDRTFMLEVKSGVIDMDSALNMVDFYWDSRIETLKDRYINSKKDIVTSSEVEGIIKQLVLHNISKNMRK